MRRRGLVLLLLALGCGDNDPLTVPSTADNLCAQIAAVACHDLFACCTEGQIEAQLGVANPRTELECRGDFERTCTRTIAPYAAAIRDKRVTLDGKILDTCLHALVAPEGVCVAVEAELPWKLACLDSAWVGQVATGGTCRYALECAGHDSVCAPNQTCKTLPGSGQACTMLPCATGFYCGPGDRICHPQGAASAICGSSAQCQKGLYCEIRLGLPVCTPLHGRGDVCTGSEGCESGLCLPAACRTSMNPCFIDNDCAFRSFCAGTQTPCSTNSQCTPATCVPDTCASVATCGDDQLVIDYCTQPIASLPIPVP